MTLSHVYTSERRTQRDDFRGKIGAMVVAATDLMRAGCWYALATRPVLPDRRRRPRNDYVLFDGDGRQLGTVVSAQGRLTFGPGAPAVFLLRNGN